MNMLAVCSKVLYDHDILAKQNELDNYKKDMIQPIVYFESDENFNSKKSSLFLFIEKNVASWYNKYLSWSLASSMDDLSIQLKEYDNMEYFQVYLYEYILEALEYFFGPSTWLCNTVKHMCIGLESTIISVIEMGSYRSCIHRRNFSIIVQNSIKKNLERLIFTKNQNDFFKFKCKYCLKYHSWNKIDDNICLPCSEKHIDDIEKKYINIV